MNPRHLLGCNREGRRDRSRDQSHSDYRTEAENPEIERRPEWLWNGAQDQQRYSGATREPVRHADAKRAQQRAPYRERRQRAGGRAVVMQRDLL